MNEFRPAWIPDPQRAAAACTEMPPRRADLNVTGSLLLNSSLVDADIIITFDIKRVEIGTEVNRISPTSGGLATNGAVTQIERVWLGAGYTESHAPAMT